MNNDNSIGFYDLCLRAIVELARVCQAPSVTSPAGAPESRDLQ